MDLHYQSGFGNHFESEAIPHTLPRGQNSPQQPPRGLYAEQLSGSSFTSPRHRNLRTWLYRIQPSVTHVNFKPRPSPAGYSTDFRTLAPTPAPLRWNPLALPTHPTDFIDGLVTIAGHGSPETHQGAVIHLYAANQSMQQRYFYDADGDLLIVPQQGRLRCLTELGVLELEPGEILVIPRGIVWRMELLDGEARGYICENYGAPFLLPDLGPIGANGLANPRDFQIPVAFFEESPQACQIDCKFQDNFWTSESDHSPLNVVAWHGNYAPYKYNLHHFNTMNTVSYDHPDPSIFTVLTAPTAIPGVANVDFVIFPERWMVAEHTFRPPYYHRNIMSEYMGLISGQYDAKGADFAPGGGSLHNCMTGHGPDAKAYAQGRGQTLSPDYYRGTLAFMFESYHVFAPTRYAMSEPLLQGDYVNCWRDLKSQFST
jgi:homogentisate 1,2-dioxygenase